MRGLPPSFPSGIGPRGWRYVRLPLRQRTSRSLERRFGSSKAFREGLRSRSRLHFDRLLTDDLAEASEIAARLDQLNRERQEIEKATLEAAEAEALASLGLEEKGALVLATGEGWHPGVVGLVAARLRERFGRPAFAIAFLGQTGTGSGRSRSRA